MGHITSETLRHIYREFNHKLTDLNHEWLDCNALSNAVAAKGAPLRNCIGFIVGTVRPVSRPTYNQREFYNGHKRVHALKYQSLMLANGIIGHMHGLNRGKVLDSRMFDESELIDQLHTLGDYCVYGDPAYRVDPHLMTPYRRTGRLTPEQDQFNRDMSAVCSCVEWGFGEILKLFAFLDLKKNQKVYLQAVGKYYLVGCLFYNRHTCLYGNLTSSFFECQPPSLEEYLS